MQNSIISTSTKKIFLILLISIVSVLGIEAFMRRSGMRTEIRPEQEVLDLSTLENGGRKILLQYMTETDRDVYNKHNTFMLDDNDPSTKVVIGAYSTEEDNGTIFPGGIIMLKRLPDGKDSIYWEITSPLLRTGLASILFLKDINNDGLKEIGTVWNGGIDDIYHSAYWILTLDPHTKTYKVLNVIIDKDKNLYKNIDFSHPDPSRVYLNRFQVQSVGDAFGSDIIQDIDNDGIAEIVLKYPALEWFGIIGLPDNIKTSEFTQIYKWNGTEYYLWKETVEKKTYE